MVTTPPVTARAWRLWLAYAALSVYFTWPLAESRLNLGISDWDPILLFHANVFRSLYEYGQLPFWNPWSCGGNPLWQNPQVPLMSPVYLLALGMPLVIAMKVTIFLHYVVGFAGMHLLLTRVFKVTFAPALLLLASLFVLAGGIAMHLAVGHATFLPYFYVPWVVWAFISATTSGRLNAAVAAGVIMAAAIYMGGIHMVFMTAVALTCFTIVAAATRREWRPVAMLAVTGAIAGLLAAPKLIPVLAFLRDPGLVDIRVIHPHDVMSRDMLLHSFLNPFQYLREIFAGQNYGWHEYGNYTGSFGVLAEIGALAAIAVDRPWRRSQWLGVSLGITAVLLFLLTIGEFGPYSPYELLRRLPGVGEFRLPSRYTLVLSLFAACLVAWVVGGTDAAVSVGPPVRRFAAIVLVLAAWDLAYCNRVVLEAAFTLDPVEWRPRLLSRPGPPRIDAETDGFARDSPMMRATAEGRAVLRCNDSLLLRGEVRPDQAVVFSEGARISRIRFTPNVIEFSAIATTAARVYLNERYGRGWVGQGAALAVDPTNGLAYLALPAGAAGKFAFRFVPPGLTLGAGMGVAGLLLAALLRKRRLPGRGLPLTPPVGS